MSGGTRTTGDLVAAVVRLMPDAAVVVDGQGRIVAANALAEAVFGYPPGRLDGLDVDSLVPRYLRGLHSGHRATYAARPAQRPMGAGTELSAVRQDGTEFPVEISLAPLGVPERPLTLAAVRDLTDRRAAWEAQARLAAIVSSSDDAVVSMDLTGVITSWNPGAERLLGYGAEQIIGTSFSNLVPAEARAEMEQQMDRVRSSMRATTIDTKRLHVEGAEVDVAESISLIKERSGHATGFSCLLRDNTDRKRVERDLRRLLDDARRRERWLEAISEIRLSILSGGPLDETLDLIILRACELAEAEGAAISLPSSEDELNVVAAGGIAAAGLGATVHVGESIMGNIFTTGRSTAVYHSAQQPGADDVFLSDQKVGPVMHTALTTSSGPGGVLVVLRSDDRLGFDNDDIRMVESIGEQAGVAVEIAGAQDAQQELALTADRERIARDLHDHVIQRLFAVGMGLQAAGNAITDERARERIDESVEELDATIRDVRSTIFSLELRATEHIERSTRARILEVASSAAPAMGYQARLQFDGPIDTKVPEELVGDLLAVVREALSNTARHADATTVEVRVEVGEDLCVVVTDDGKGLGTTTRSSGISNLRARAEARGGTMAVSEPPGGGTRLEWRVPL